jgi:endonuclease/exonuclease/phosphatase (EEP) superfamily protein YafD
MTRILRLTAAVFAWAYLAGLFGWLALWLTLGDRFGYLALVHSLAVYFFVPLPVAPLLALAARSRALGVGVAAGAAVFAWLWGGLFLPGPAAANAGGPVLRVMTYNILGQAGEPAPMIAVIRGESPDVVALQEVTPAMSEALRHDLSAEYPYQVLQPEPGVGGLAVLSKLPIQPTGEALPLEWLGDPQVLTFDWQGQRVTLVNFHMYPAGLANRRIVDEYARTRRAQAAALADFAQEAGRRGPVVAAGDANSTELSEAYRVITGELADAWREAGFGFGHTFPGAVNDWSSRPVIRGVPAPQWLVRIDYVFHSRHFQAVEARTAAFDGVSDHRGVIAGLALAGK